MTAIRRTPEPPEQRDGFAEVATIDEPGSSVATGEISEEPTWFGNDTLIVS